jgi:hypothetical protein
MTFATDLETLMLECNAAGTSGARPAPRWQVVSACWPLVSRHRAQGNSSSITLQYVV